MFNRLSDDGYNPMYVNLRFAKPVDEQLLKTVCDKCRYVFSIEDNVNEGGAGMIILHTLNDMGELDRVRFHNFALPDKFIEHGTKDELYKRYGLDSESIYNEIKRLID